MSITATRFATQIRTWRLIAALTALPEHIRRLRAMDGDRAFALAA